MNTTKSPPLLLTLLVAGILNSHAYADPKPSAPTPAPSKSSGNIFDPKLLGENSENLPTFIESESLTLNSEEKRFDYRGNVIVKRGDMTLTADLMEGIYTDKNEIQKITATTNVTITKPTGLKAAGQRAVYDAANNTIVLTENPSIEQDGSILTADQIKIYLKDNRSEATGQVHVKLVKKPDAPKEGAKAAPPPAKG